MLRPPCSIVVLLAVLPAIGSVGQAAASSATPARAKTASVIVHFAAHTAPAAQNTLLARVGGRRLKTIDHLGLSVIGVPARTRATVVRELEASPLVGYAESDGLVHGTGVSADDPLLNAGYWQLANPRVPDAWSLSTGRASTVVAVLDTGIARKHEDLGATAAGYDFVNSDSHPWDDNGHGTAVAGIIAAQGGNGIGVAGVCWKCTIMPVKVLDADNSGTWSDVAAGVIWATNHGAKVINMSLGLPSGSRSVAAAISYAESHNVVVVAAAGNENSSAPDYPAAYPGVISVGAVNETGARYSTANGNTPFGNWGSNYGAWVKVDAPGCVNTTWPANPVQPNGGYTYFCGTSAAAPFVAGLAGLARSYAPLASAGQVAGAIESTAHQTADRNSAHGLIDAKATLDALGSLPPGKTLSFAPDVLTGQAPLTVRYTNTSTKSGPYSWSFGDKTTSTSTSPAHLYTRPGTYTVTLSAGSGGEHASRQITVAAARVRGVNRAGGKVSVHLTRKSFKRSQARTVKLVYSFSSPSARFSYRLEYKNGASWLLVRNVRRNGGFRGSHTLTVKELFGSAAIPAGRFRLVLSSDANSAQLGFMTR
ncbi:MAG: S8 family serine peptidase [Gaiellaceae bacterium]|jgi:subtilisin family serine protease